MPNNKIARIAVSGVNYWFDKPYSYSIPEELQSTIRPGMRVAVSFRGSRPREGLVLAIDEQTALPLKPVIELLDEFPILTPEQIKLALWMRERFFCTVSDAVRTILPAGLWYKVSTVYSVAPDVDRDAAYASAGRSAAEKMVLDAVFSHPNPCPLSDIEALFGPKNPGPALLSLVKKGILLAESSKSRRVSDKLVQKVCLAVSPHQAREAMEKNRRAVRQNAVLRVLCEMDRLSVADLCYFTGSGRDSIYRLRDKGLVKLVSEEYFRRPDYASGAEAPLPTLNTAQNRVFEGLWALAAATEPKAALLFGVTGSGKTTVYIHLIDRVLKAGKSAILLVPEISLTPQMLKTFSSHFGDEIAVLHSALSMGERYDEWKRIRTGAARLVIGTRSAVFAPVQNLGCIIIDEEQEETYKSENNVRYHARDVAVFLCSRSKALLLLGSATPNITSMYRAKQGRYALFTLLERYNKKQLPSVQIVDMKTELRNGNGGAISSFLRAELQKNMERKEQSILFLNRRGTNKFVTCVDCGFTYSCPNCTRALTYHSVGNRLMCHCCGYRHTPDRVCPECGGTLSYVGAGTQKIVEELELFFPGTEILRMDTDSLSSDASHGTLLERFRSQRIPIMVGTQMVTKGLNFENVTLVGVLSADQSLYSGSYLASERTFSLITQVIGRSGRFEKPGRAVIQSFTPENQVIQLAAKQDYESFYEAELSVRQLTGVPPYSELFVLTAAGEDELAVIRCCNDIIELLKQETVTMPDTKILGPAPMAIAKMNNIWRYRVTVQTLEGAALRRIVSAVLMACNNDKNYRGISVWADYDPLD